MARLAIRLAALAAVGIFAAMGATLALIGLGTPFLLASLVTALVAGLIAWAVLRATLVHPLSSLGPGTPASLAPTLLQDRERLATLEQQTASLRHDVRGLLSPAMLMTDRLVSHPDPKIVRAGETIIRAITRAADRLAETRRS